MKLARVTDTTVHLQSVIGCAHYGQGGAYQATTNKLRWVDDYTTAAYAAGAKDQDADNFGYDDIGNLRKDLREGIGTIEWNVYGKVDKVDRVSTGDNANNSRPRLYFDYDASGNRVSKTVAQPTGSSVNTYYVRDAQGNVMGVYEQINSGLLLLEEFNVYGIGRLGLLKPSFEVSNTSGQKSYELRDHLGNVSAVLSDKKGIITGVTGYYPFGMAMGGRSLTQSYGFRYGFNGMEKESNWTENYNFGARIFDAKLGRWLSVDPRSTWYPAYSSYSYAANSPNTIIDKEGEFLGTIIGTVVGGTVGGVIAAVKGDNIWKGIGKGAISGAVAGAIVDITVATAGTGTVVIVAAGALSGAGGNAVHQGLDLADGSREEFSYWELGASTALGAPAVRSMLFSVSSVRSQLLTSDEK